MMEEGKASEANFDATITPHQNANPKITTEAEPVRIEQAVPEGEENEAQ